MNLAQVSCLARRAGVSAALFFLNWLFAGCSSYHGPAEFEVEGVVQSGAAPSVNFRVFVSGHHWLIRCTPTQSVGAPAWWESGSIGNFEVISTLAVDQGDRISAMIEPGCAPVMAGARRGGSIFPPRQTASFGGTVLFQSPFSFPMSFSPVGVPGCLAHLWLMFCSAPFMNAQMTNDPDLAYQSGFEFGIPSTEDVEGNLDSRWQRDERPPKLPRQVTFLNHGKRPAWDGGSVRMMPYPSPFDRGFVEAQYRVTSVTNTGGRHGLTLPRTFEFERYQPRLGAASESDVFSVQRLTGEVRVVRAGCSLGSFLPRIGKTNFVSDRRLARSEPEIGIVNYFLDTNHWPSVAELRAIHQQQEILLHPELGFQLTLPKAPPLRERWGLPQYLTSAAGLGLAGIIALKIGQAIRASVRGPVKPKRSLP